MHRGSSPSLLCFGLLHLGHVALRKPRRRPLLLFGEALVLEEDGARSFEDGLTPMCLHLRFVLLPLRIGNLAAGSCGSAPPSSSAERLLRGVQAFFPDALFDPLIIVSPLLGGEGPSGRHHTIWSAPGVLSSGSVENSWKSTITLGYALRGLLLLGSLPGQQTLNTRESAIFDTAPTQANIPNPPAPQAGEIIPCKKNN